MTSVAVNWSSASIYVEKITFIGKNNSLHDSTSTVQNIVSVGKTNSVLDTTITVEKNLDIFNADALVGIIQLPPGSYEDVEIKMFCKKSQKSEMAFNFSGTFTNTKGEQDSVVTGSSFPFEANLTITDIVIDPSANYTATFSFDLNKVLTGISTSMLETANVYIGADGKKIYNIWKGGSDEEPFYDQVIQNWQTVGNVILSKS